MKRFLVFAGERHYPSGGWQDFVGSFDTLDEAQAYREKLEDIEWYQIVDTTTGQFMNQKIHLEGPTITGWVVHHHVSSHGYQSGEPPL